MYTAFPETILDTESNSCASTRFDSEPRRIADAYFVMEFVNAFVGADEVVLSLVAVAELFFWYRYDDDDMLFLTSSSSSSSSRLTLFLSHHREGLLRSRFHHSRVTLGKKHFSNFRSSFPHFCLCTTTRAETCAALSSSSALARPPLLLPRFLLLLLLLLLLHDDDVEMATTAFIFFVPRRL